MKTIEEPSLEEILGSDPEVAQTRLRAAGPAGKLPLTEEMLLHEPSGNLFGLTQNAGMGWNPSEVNRDAFLILSTHGGLRQEDGQPLALGYHTGHWEVNLLVGEAAATLKARGALPFAAYCSDPCDGRTQGTSGMMDSLPYRNDAAMVLRRLVRSLPTRKGLLGVGTCDKGLPAMMLCLAGCSTLPGLIVPGGVTLPTEAGEDAGTVQSLGARFSHGLIDLDYAAEMGCRACGSPGGGCQFLGTAATSQVVAEALGISLPHSALCPSGEPMWLDMARRSALALLRLYRRNIPLSRLLTQPSVENTMLVHAAFGGSTNLLLHIPALAHAAGLPLPEVEDWSRINRSTPTLVDVLPNGPRNHPTAQVFMAGAVPEVMLHLRRMELLDRNVLTASGETLDSVLDWWQESPRRLAVQRHLMEREGVDPGQVIMDADRARENGLTSTVVFPVGNLAPQGSVIKATSIDPTVIDSDNVYRHRGPARIFTSERDAIQSIKGLSSSPLSRGDVLVLIGVGPLGTGMEEIYQITAALKFLPWGKEIAVITDARFSGVSTGACVGHVGPEALAGGPIGRLRNGDRVEIVIDREKLQGRIDLVGTENGELTPREAELLLQERNPHPHLAPHPHLPDDTRLWAALQSVSGGTWRGAIYDVDRIVETLRAGQKALESSQGDPDSDG